MLQLGSEYEKLGFPGVFLATRGDDWGAIKDVRDASTAPTYLNFLRKVCHSFYYLTASIICAALITTSIIFCSLL